MIEILVFQVLLVPVHAVLAWVYLVLGRGRSRAKQTRRFDVIAILAALAVWMVVVWSTSLVANPTVSRMWPVVLATFFSFLAYSAVLAAALALRCWRAGKEQVYSPRP